MIEPIRFIVDAFVQTDMNLSICRRCGKKIRTKQHEDCTVEIFIDEHIKEYHEQEYELFRTKWFEEKEK